MTPDCLAALSVSLLLLYAVVAAVAAEAGLLYTWPKELSQTISLFRILPFLALLVANLSLLLAKRSGADEPKTTYVYWSALILALIAFVTGPFLFSFLGGLFA